MRGLPTGHITLFHCLLSNGGTWLKIRNKLITSELIFLNHVLESHTPRDTSYCSRINYYLFSVIFATNLIFWRLDLNLRSSLTWQFLYSHLTDRTTLQWYKRRLFIIKMKISEHTSCSFPKYTNYLPSMSWIKKINLK